MIIAEFIDSACRITYWHLVNFGPHLMQGRHRVLNHPCSPRDCMTRLTRMNGAHEDRNAGSKIHAAPSRMYMARTWLLRVL